MKKNPCCVHVFWNKNRKVPSSLKISCRGVVTTGYSVKFGQVPDAST